MSSKLQHRWSVSQNYLAGITSDNWRRLLAINGFAVDPVYWHRAVFITATSLLNSFYRWKEEKWFDSLVHPIQVQPPLFILGHWRSGTTHLHNLIAQDTRQFAFANTYQVVNPHTFLTTEQKISRRFAWILPDKRPMDNVALSFQSPQEDEFAPCLMSLKSVYLGISFPRNEKFYSRYLTFQDASASEWDEWNHSFLWFLKKLTFKYNRPLVLKSPPHTARIRLLLQTFPRARFVHIHRHPYSVFQSCRHYWNTATWHTYLQRPELENIHERILHRYKLLYDAYFEARNLIPRNRLHEIRFEDLERDPIGELQQMYDHLELSGFEENIPQWKEYVASLKGYRKNRFQPLDDSLKLRVAKLCKRSFDEWKYSL